MIGICYEYAPYHTNYILEWVELQKEVDKNGTRIVINYIDPCITSIYQPCGVVINRPLKKKIRGFYQEYINSLNSQPGDKIHVSREKQVDMLMIYLSGSTTKRCLNHIFGTLPLYVDWIHMFKTNPYSRHIWISSLKIWFMIHYYAPMKVWNLKVPLMVLNMLTSKRMTPKIKMIPSTSLRPIDDRFRNIDLTIYLPIYLLVCNIYLITNNNFDLLIQAYLYYHVIAVEIFQHLGIIVDTLPSKCSQLSVL